MSFDFRLHTVTYSEVDENGFIGIQFDAFGEQDSGMPTVEVHHPFGLMANPPEPDPNNPGFSCLALIGWEGDEAHAWLCSDPRSRVVLPFLKKGETLLYGQKGNFVRMHDDGRVSVFTTDDGTVNGKTISFQVKPDGFLWSAPWGKITFDATGFHVVHVSGAAIDLGAIGGLPDPLSAISSYVKMTAGMVQTEATVVANGTAGGAAEPVTKATSNAAVLAALQAVLVAVDTLVAATKASSMPLTPDPGGAASLAFGAATTAFHTALSGAATLVGAAPVATASSSLAVT